MRLLLIMSAALLLVACNSQQRQQQQPANTASQQHTQQAPPGAKQYELRGTVVAVYKDKHELRVKHQDIPGYMHGMTMNFPVRDAALASLAPGDEITADLVVAAPGEYWLANIRKSSPVKLAP